ncbi:MAG: exodeoxyribonuclease VII large subunit [Desulfobacterales bacterium]
MNHWNGSLPRQIYQVSELTANIKSLLEEKFSIIWITGEISNLSKPVSGHYYFSLKDRSAQINAVMFRNQNRRLNFIPENGMQITALGRISVYEPRGTYQIIIEHLEPKGVGALQIAFEQLKEKLSREGLFDPSIKKPIPLLAEKICVITSSTGAVVHDIIKIATRRFPNIFIQILPVSVQGDSAEREIADAIAFMNANLDSDVAILARGGGSIEDLWAFNTETVARAIFSSNIPIVSAVGHETDYTISDFVADFRAPTPSAAAELLTPVKTDMLHHIESKRNQLGALMQQRVKQCRHQIRELSSRLSNPKKTAENFRLKIDDLCNQMVKTLSFHFRYQSDQFSFQKKRLASSRFRDQVKKNKEKLKQNYSNIFKSMDLCITRNRFRLLEATGKMNALSPIAVLERGYSITRKIINKKIIQDSEAVSIGEHLEIILAKGILTCNVEGKSSHVKKDI